MPVIRLDISLNPCKWTVLAHFLFLKFRSKQAPLSDALLLGGLEGAGSNLRPTTSCRSRALSSTAAVVIRGEGGGVPANCFQECCLYQSFKAWKKYNCLALQKKCLWSDHLYPHYCLSGASVWSTHEVTRGDMVPAVAQQQLSVLPSQLQINLLPKELQRNHSKPIVGSRSAECSFLFFCPRCCFQSFGRLTSLPPTPPTSSSLWGPWFVMSFSDSLPPPLHLTVGSISPQSQIELG